MQNNGKKIDKILKDAEAYLHKHLDKLVGSKITDSFLESYLETLIDSVAKMFPGYKFKDKIEFIQKGMRVFPANIETALLVHGISPEIIENAVIDGNIAIINKDKYEYDPETGIINVRTHYPLYVIDITLHTR